MVPAHVVCKVLLASSQCFVTSCASRLGAIPSGCSQSLDKCGRPRRRRRGRAHLSFVMIPTSRAQASCMEKRFSEPKVAHGGLELLQLENARLES